MRHCQCPLVLALVFCAAGLAGGVAVCTGNFGADSALDSTLAAGDAGVARAIAYVDDGVNKMLVTGGEDQIMRAWDIKVDQSTALTPRLYKGHEEAIWSLVWISELNVLASACGDGFIRFWPSSVLAVHQPCTGVGDCCDGWGLGCRGDHVVSWLHTGMKRRRQIHSLAWVPGGGSTGTLVSGWGDGSVRTWNYDGTSWSYGKNLQGDDWDTADRAYDMVWLPGAGVLASASPDWPHARLWNDLATPDQYDVLDKDVQHADLCNWAHCDATLALDTNAAGDVLATGSQDNSVRLWDPVAKTSFAKLTSHTDYVTSLAWLHTEDLIASGGADGTIRFWDSTVTSDTSATAQELTTGHSGSVNAVVWIPDFMRLAAADSDGNVKLWACADAR